MGKESKVYNSTVHPHLVKEKTTYLKNYLPAFLTRKKSVLRRLIRKVYWKTIIYSIPWEWPHVSLRHVTSLVVTSNCFTISRSNRILELDLDVEMEAWFLSLDFKLLTAVCFINTFVNFLQSLIRIIKKYKKINILPNNSILSFN